MSMTSSTSPEEFFQHEFPHERSGLSHWRKRLGGKLELLLAESLRVAHESVALRTTAMPPTSSSAPSVTTFASFSPGEGSFCASSYSRYSRPSQSASPQTGFLTGDYIVVREERG